MRGPPAFDTSSVKMWEYGGAHFPEDQLVALEQRFGGEVHGIWGMTECTAPVTSSFTTRRKSGSAGRALGGLRIIGPDGAELAAGETGELWVSGPSLMLGYYGMPEETKQVLVDGWLRTGDLARLDADGDLFLTGRMEIIIRGGETSYPEEIESVIVGSEGVQTCAVVGLPNELLGEEAVAFVQVRLGADRDLVVEDVRRACRENLTAYKVPRIEVVSESRGPRSARSGSPCASTARTRSSWRAHRRRRPACGFAGHQPPDAARC